jgi:hypothetical protein
MPTVDLTAAIWRKSTRSGNNGGDCVEVAVVRGRDAGVANKAGEEFVIIVRDTKNRDRQPQVFTISEWDAFLADAREGRFDSSVMIEELRSAPVA